MNRSGHRRRVALVSSGHLSGGILTYVRQLSAQVGNNYEFTHVDDAARLDLRDFDIINYQTLTTAPTKSFPKPSVFTVHDHNVYCPSGSKYLFGQAQECTRIRSPWGCAAGLILDGCGSRRPDRIAEYFRRSYGNFSAFLQRRVRMVCNSDYVRSQLVATGYPAELATTVRLSVPPPTEEPTSPGKRFLFVGRLVPTKGLRWLLEALALTPAEICLDIVGGGWGSDQARADCSRLGLGERVIFHGPRQAPEVQKFYRDCFAVIFPSLYPEPAGYVPLEAKSMARPVIASRTGGIPEYVKDGVTGLLVETGNTKDLAAAIVKLWNDPARAMEMGLSGRSVVVQEFNFARHLNGLLDVYDQAERDFAG